LVIGIAALSTSICIAYLMHLVIEKPFTRLRRRVSLQREKTREATLGEVGSAPVLE
jgi:peptidoglycan/LPS O-acetylase OafA/YrhL